MNDQNVDRIGDAAQRLANCFGVDQPLPFDVPVWIADPNCEQEPYPAMLAQLRTAEGNGQGHPSYADLTNRQSVSALQVFLRGNGYRSPETMTFEDDFGTLKQPGQQTQRLPVG
jgi:hypothetical protein